MTDFTDLLKSITKLKTLISFSMEHCTPPSDKDLLKLSVLSDLTEINIGRKLPSALLSSLPNLQMYVDYSSGSMDDLENQKSVGLVGSDRMSIGTLTALERLYSERTFSELKSTNLTSLRLRPTNRMVEDIFYDPSNHLLTNLTSLELQMQDNYFVVDPLLELTNLEHLKINAYSVNHIELCKNFTKLKSFVLDDPPRMDYDENLTFLSGLTNLERLSLRLINETLLEISPLTKVTKLDLRTVVLFEGGVGIYRYPHLSVAFPNLETLKVDAAQGYDMDGILRLSKLTSLNFPTMCFPNNVSELTDLRELHIPADKLDLLAGFSKLESLAITNAFNEGCLKKIEHLAKLTQLIIRRSDIAKFSPQDLFKLTSLQRLSVSVNSWKEKQTKELFNALPNLHYALRGG